MDKIDGLFSKHRSEQNKAVEKLMNKHPEILNTLKGRMTPASTPRELPPAKQSHNKSFFKE